MSITPQGRSIQSMYGDYRDGKLIVNRRYQRKLVWSLEEKRKLIDSILQDYPVPLILLAELRSGTWRDPFDWTGLNCSSASFGSFFFLGLGC
jgi:uncharacterized protein with ParB-like and HNH nuclease domain